MDIPDPRTTYTNYKIIDPSSNAYKYADWVLLSSVNEVLQGHFSAFTGIDNDGNWVFRRGNYYPGYGIIKVKFMCIPREMVEMYN